MKRKTIAPLSGGASDAKNMDIDDEDGADSQASDANPPAAKLRKRNEKGGNEFTVTDLKSPTSSPTLVVEVVAGTGECDTADGPLSMCEFHGPRSMCQYGDSLIVVDMGSHVVRVVEGVLGVNDPLAESDPSTVAGFEARAVPLIMTAVEVLPTELARMMAQYARPIGGQTHTIAGQVRGKGRADGPALGGARLNWAACVAMDTTDPVAGPQLIISDGDRIRCLNMRTRMLTTIAGSSAGRFDTSALQAQFEWAHGIAVAPNGAVFVSDLYNASVRRISAAKWPASGGKPAERVVTTLIGRASPNVRFAQSSAQSFRQRLFSPWAMALHASTRPSVSSSDTADNDDTDRDVGQLYVGCRDGVHVFDLEEGKRKHLPWPVPNGIQALVLTEDGTRLFAVSTDAVDMVDARTGARTGLFNIPIGHVGHFRAGPVTSDPQTTGGFEDAMGCVIDKATRSLVMCDFGANRIIRLRGVDV